MSRAYLRASVKWCSSSGSFDHLSVSATRSSDRETCRSRIAEERPRPRLSSFRKTTLSSEGERRMKRFEGRNDDLPAND